MRMGCRGKRERKCVIESDEAQRNEKNREQKNVKRDRP